MKCCSWFCVAVFSLATIASSGATADDEAASGVRVVPSLMGLPVSQTAMARTLLFGNLATRNPEKALALLHNASDSHYGPAEFVLGGVLANDKQDTAKINEGSEYLARAARDGCSGAAGLLGNMLYAASAQHPETEAVALKFLRAGAEGGDALAQGMLGAAYSRGSRSLPKEPVAAYAWVRLSLSHQQQSQRMHDASTALEQRVLGALEKGDRERAEKLATEFLARYGRQKYAFCSQSDDLTKSPE
jgi:TPR repeat protein